MDAIINLINSHATEKKASLRGIVSKNLDDKEIKGAVHQRFVVCLENGLTVLLTLNLNQTKRMEVMEGDMVEASGLYVYDFRGGYVHHLYDDGFVKLVEKGKVREPRAYPIYQLFHHRQTNRYIEVYGRVNKLLKEDEGTSPHQKFLINTDLRQSIMVVVNLEHMQRIDIQVGDSVEVEGVYVWNQYGGLVHITHHDHFGNHPNGSIYVARLGKTFE